MKKLLKNKKLLVVVVIIILLGSVGGYFLYSYLNAPSVEVSTVSQGKLVDYVSETGTVKAYKNLRISSQVNGVVENIYFKIGDSVKKDDTILTVAATDIDLQVQALYAQRQRLKSLHNQLVNPPNNQIENMELEVQSLEKQMALAKERYDNSIVLFNEGAISKIEYEEIESAYLSAKNSYQIAANNLENLKQGGNKYEKEQLDYQIREIDYNIARMKNNREYYSITAPYDGVITSMNINEGEVVVPGNPFGGMANLEKLYLYCEIISSKLELLEAGSKVEVQHEHLDQTSLVVNKIYPTALDKLSDLGISQKRVGVEIALPDKSSLRVGSEIDVEIITREKEDALFIPNEAVYSLQGQSYVMVVDGNKSREVAIETGWDVVDYTEIASGLEVNDTVIITNLSDLSDGGYINIDE
ncbi:MAG: efflux RND transporter periplasmic adaptor subunit [Clostridia bacterium]